KARHRPQCWRSVTKLPDRGTRPVGPSACPIAPHYSTWYWCNRWSHPLVHTTRMGPAGRHAPSLNRTIGPSPPPPSNQVQLRNAHEEAGFSRSSMLLSGRARLPPGGSRYPLRLTRQSRRWSTKQRQGRLSDSQTLKRSSHVSKPPSQTSCIGLWAIANRLSTSRRTSLSRPIGHLPLARPFKLPRS